ncbi:hypothetical protein ALP50_102663 [Pseudomonas syringae pv. spinaceae]|uniref:Uncharacterized protein n=2 Tax=Pseudomonas syringae group genomosp. 3 TaxID=251701 RepID=A0A3M3N0G4_9PSED|nr:hypothetical protein ALO84_101811 [Pseudomonas syringae pv. maculicola]MCF5226991.1 hypothetical protein [Pseudomonas syringae]POD69340.1 hypothetical protein BKM07_11495 [Pseudomonas syringae group genomosp. 3]RMN40213.1 hypothetical protein ALQ59_102291 [Pseudomonas syringae pv. apii]RMT22725.1 hypothetical protein ALP50_102663 [Pseudomonas syringae pv. spinaceae]
MIVPLCVTGAFGQNQKLTLIIVPMLRVGMPFWTLCVLCVALRATIGFCAVRWIYIILKAPFRPSASDFDGSK